MKQMVLAVFANDTAALEGLRELRDLHSEGGVSLYASAVVVKDDDDADASGRRGHRGAR